MSTAFERRHPFTAYVCPALAYAVLIFVMSSIPGDELPDIPLWSFDKFVHLFEFGLLGMLVYRAARFHYRLDRPYLVTVVLCTFYGGLDELHQLFVPGRLCDPADFAMDAAGVLLFAGVSAMLNRNVPDRRGSV